MNLQKMLKQAQEMQAKLSEVQAKAEATETEGSAGGGMVKIRINGKGLMLKLSLDDSLLVPAEKEVLEDLIIAAYNDAKQKSESTFSDEVSKLTSGLPLPPGFKLPF